MRHRDGCIALFVVLALCAASSSAYHPVGSVTSSTNWVFVEKFCFTYSCTLLLLLLVLLVLLVLNSLSFYMILCVIFPTLRLLTVFENSKRCHHWILKFHDRLSRVRSSSRDLRRWTLLMAWYLSEQHFGLQLKGTLPSHTDVDILLKFTVRCTVFGVLWYFVLISVFFLFVSVCLSVVLFELVFFIWGFLHSLRSLIQNTWKSTIRSQRGIHRQTTYWRWERVCDLASGMIIKCPSCCGKTSRVDRSFLAFSFVFVFVSCVCLFSKGMWWLPTVRENLSPMWSTRCTLWTLLWDSNKSSPSISLEILLQMQSSSPSSSSTWSCNCTPSLSWETFKRRFVVLFCVCLFVCGQYDDPSFSLTFRFRFADHSLVYGIGVSHVRDGALATHSCRCVSRGRCGCSLLGCF